MCSRPPYGDLSRVGLLTQLYDRRTVLGRDEPGMLLMGDRPEGESTTALPAERLRGRIGGGDPTCADLEQTRP